MLSFLDEFKPAQPTTPSAGGHARAARPRAVAQHASPAGPADWSSWSPTCCRRAGKRRSAAWPARSGEVVVLHTLSPQELRPTLGGDVRLIDRESGAAVSGHAQQRRDPPVRPAPGRLAAQRRVVLRPTRHGLRPGRHRRCRSKRWPSTSSAAGASSDESAHPARAGAGHHPAGRRRLLPAQGPAARRRSLVDVPVERSDPRPRRARAAAAPQVEPAAPAAAPGAGADHVCRRATVLATARPEAGPGDPAARRLGQHAGPGRPAVALRESRRSGAQHPRRPARKLAGDGHSGRRPPAGAGRRDVRSAPGRPRAGRRPAIRRRRRHARGAPARPLARRRPELAPHLSVHRRAPSPCRPICPTTWARSRSYPSASRAPATWP